MKTYSSADSTRVIRLLEVLFLILLVVRSSTEAFSSLAIAIGPTVVNVSVAVVLLMDAIGGIYLGLLWIRREWNLDRIGLIFLVWVLSLAPWVYLAASQWGIPGLTGAREWVRLLSLVLLYLAVRAIALRRGPERVLRILLLALPVPLAATYYQILVSPDERAFGVMVHPNNLAAFLVVMIALIVWRIAHPMQSTRGRLLWGSILLLILGGLIASVSSNGWLMFGVFLIAFALLAGGWRFKAVGITVGLAFLTLFSVLFLQETRLQREIWQNLEALGFSNPEESLGGGTLEGRFVMWKGLVKVWERQPLQGYGLNATPFVNPVVGKLAHNDFIRYLVEGGVFGLLLFVFFQAAVGKELFRLWRGAGDPKNRLLVGLGFGVYLAWVVGSIGSNLITHTVFQVYFWALLASVSALGGGPSRLHGAEGVKETERRAEAATKRRASYMPLREWLESAVSAPKGEQPLACRRCRTAALTSAGVLCRRCLAPLMSSGGVALLVILIVASIGSIGFYLWNQGAGLETFFFGWFLWYVLLATLLRNQRERYVYTLLATVLVGFAAVSQLYPLLPWDDRTVAWLAILGLFGLGLYGLLASGWRVWQGRERSVRYFLPVGLALCALRFYLLPLGALWVAAGVLDSLLRQASLFLYGDAAALGQVFASVMALFPILWLFLWGVTGRSLLATLLDLVPAYLFLLLLVQVGVWISTAVLWTTAKLLPMYAFTERFAPLLLERPVGLYTWISLGSFMALATGWLAARSRLRRRRRGRTTGSVGLRFRR